MPTTRSTKRPVPTNGYDDAYDKVKGWASANNDGADNQTSANNDADNQAGYDNAANHNKHASANNDTGNETGYDSACDNSAGVEPKYKANAEGQRRRQRCRSTQQPT